MKSPLNAGRAFKHLVDKVPKGSKIAEPVSLSADSYKMVLKATKRKDIKWEPYGDIPLSTSAKHHREISKRSGSAGALSKEDADLMVTEAKQMLEKYDIPGEIKIIQEYHIQIPTEKGNRPRREWLAPRTTKEEALKRAKELKGKVIIDHRIKIPNIALTKLKQIFGPGFSTAALLDYARESKETKEAANTS
jgi:hypothetical protein